jgi:CheY-like chemotaxis protein
MYRSAAAETVLVVEDDDDVRAYTVGVLRELGYRVIEAYDGAAALRLLEKQDRGVDLLLTDVVMPVMSGRTRRGRAPLPARAQGFSIIRAIPATRSCATGEEAQGLRRAGGAHDEADPASR